MDNSTEEIVGLPPFEYTGEDLAVKAICEYLYEEQKDAYLQTENSVWIPEFFIYKEVEKDGEYLVFGNFWSANYVQIGDILEVCSGGAMPACFHLKKTSNGYKVISYEKAGDGADYSADIKSFTKGYPGLYRKFFADNEEKRINARKKFIRMYVEEHQLDIRYYKDFGWDPVEIY